MELSEITDYFEAHSARFVEEWKEFLRIPSISSNSSFSAEVGRCANWVSSHLKQIGFQTEIWQTEGQPVVFAYHPGFSDQPTPSVVYYGHYDVQPPEPLEEWKSDPFEPEIREGRLYARGAQDNKGQLMYVFKALEFLIENKALQCPMKLCIEGEEESLSPSINKRLPVWADKLSADVLMSCDTEARTPGVPSIRVGLRGWAATTIKLHGPKSDLHSGTHGGVCPNPALGLARLLSTLHDDQGKVAVEGFYDDVAIPTDAERRIMEESNVDDDAYKTAWGVYPRGGERNLSFAERVGRRPTIEINGMYSGHTGEGVKTIIPAYAVCKLTMRIVANQDPQKVLASLKHHLEQNTPEYFTLELSDMLADGAALMVDPNSEEVVHARKVLEEVCEKPAEIGWDGGSIPILAKFVDLLKCKPVLVGFGLPEDNIHAPNESFRLDQFRLGFLYAARFLSTFGKGE